MSNIVEKPCVIDSTTDTFYIVDDKGGKKDPLQALQSAPYHVFTNSSSLVSTLNNLADAEESILGKERPVTVYSYRVVDGQKAHLMIISNDQDIDFAIENYVIPAHGTVYGKNFSERLHSLAAFIVSHSHQFDGIYAGAHGAGHVSALSGFPAAIFIRSSKMKFIKSVVHHDINDIDGIVSELQ